MQRVFYRPRAVFIARSGRLGYAGRMKHIFVLTSILFIAACAAPAVADAPVLTPAAYTPPEDNFETREKAATDALTAGGNTYAQTCGPVRARFDQSAPRARFADRKAAADAHNRRAGGQLLPGATPQHIAPPTPVFPIGETARASVVCDVIFDVDARGLPGNIDAVCSNQAYVGAAISGFATARFTPVADASGKAVAQHGIFYPLEFCFND
jgi:hypothetical protein